MSIDKPDHDQASTESSEKRIKDAALLADEGNGDLAENLRVFETPEGVVVYAATDRGIGKRENHDRVVISPRVSQFSILDGMNSAEASHVVAEEILAHADAIPAALENARSALRTRRIHDGTTLITAKLTPEKTLRVAQSGDCGAIIFDASGKVTFAARRQVKFRTTTLDVDLKSFGVKRTSQRLVDTSSVSPIFSTSGVLHDYDDVKLSKGDTVMLFSDAVWSNFSADELSQLVSQNRNPRNLFGKIAEGFRQKMRAADSLLSSVTNESLGAMSERVRHYYDCDYVPHADNQSLIIFQV